MSEKRNNEEVDLTSLIKEFKSFITSIGKTIGNIFRVIGKAIRFLFSKLKFISIVAMIGGLIGIIVHFSEETKYQSSLLIKMNVDAREQLSSDISYIKSLLEKEELNDLSTLFNITKKEASTIKDIEATPYIPEVERLKNFSNIYTSLDSNIRDIIGINFNLVNTTNNLSYITDKFNIKLTSTNPKVFSEIESGLLNFISKSKELNYNLEIEITELKYREQTLMKQIADLDTLKKVLNSVLIEESKAKNRQSQTTIQFNQSDNNNKFDILEVHQRSRELADQLAEISSKIKKLNGVYTVKSHFNKFGQESSYILIIKILIGVVLGAVLSVLLIIIKVPENKVN